MFTRCLQVRFILPFKQQQRQETLIKLQRNLFSKSRFCERRSFDFVDFNLPLKEFNQKRIKSIWLWGIQGKNTGRSIIGKASIFFFFFLHSFQFSYYDLINYVAWHLLTKYIGITYFNIWNIFDTVFYTMRCVYDRLNFIFLR